MESESSTLALYAPALFTKRTPTFHKSLLVDALVFVSVPIALQALLSPYTSRRLLKFSKRAVMGNPDAGFVVREINSTTTYNTVEISRSTTAQYDKILQKAIAVHLADLLKLDSKDVVYELVEKRAEELKPKSNGQKDEEDDYNYYEEEKASKRDAREYKQIQRLRVGALPWPKEWVEIQPGIFFQHFTYHGDDPDDQDEEREGAEQTRTVTVSFRFKIKQRKGTRRIDRLLRRAFLNYQKIELAEAANDTARYMYIQSNSKPGGSGGGGDDGDKKTNKNSITYKRYVLGEDKRFSNLFFDEKQQVVQLLDHFLAKSGKFGINGFPYKLGLLLHGPPGTGKTSLIKAVAQHTKRHIVTISLAKIKTNQELLDALFDLRFHVEDRDLPVTLTFKDVVFVMEDIDCAASVVLSRDHQAPKPTHKRSLIRSRDGDTKDKLNLSGLLNALDGVIDCPGRIVIMTTNHPEKLDPALVRPGRVNKQLSLGFMSRTQMRLMIEYYFSTTLSATQVEALEYEAECSQWTPAQVEEVCAEQSSVDAVIKCLRGHPHALFSY